MIQEATTAFHAAQESKGKPLPPGLGSPLTAARQEVAIGKMRNMHRRAGLMSNITPLLKHASVGSEMVFVDRNFARHAFVLTNYTDGNVVGYKPDTHITVKYPLRNCDVISNRTSEQGQALGTPTGVSGDVGLELFDGDEDTLPTMFEQAILERTARRNAQDDERYG
jgi:hypothetical protein